MSLVTMMNAGALRYRIKIWWGEETKNQLGEVVFVWRFLRESWAAVESISGRERVTNSRQEFSTTHRVVLRGARDTAPDIHPNYRMTWGDRALEISSVNSLDRNRWIELQCTELRTPGKWLPEEECSCP